MEGGADGIFKIGKVGSGLGSYNEPCVIPAGEEEASHLSVVNYHRKVHGDLIHSFGILLQGEIAVTGAAAGGMAVQIASVGLGILVVLIKLGKIVIVGADNAMRVITVGAYPILGFVFNIIRALFRRLLFLLPLFFKAVEAAVFQRNVFRASADADGASVASCVLENAISAEKEELSE